jgi:hypothetical protein
LGSVAIIKLPMRLNFDLFSITFDSFGASQAVYKNLRYLKSHLWKEIYFLGYFVISVQAANKTTTFGQPNIN